MSKAGKMIDETNFDKYFFPIKNFTPQKDQVLARFSAIAEFVNAFPKDQIVNLLRNNSKGGDLAPQVLRNICNVSERESIRLALDIANDMLSGLSDEEVLNKPYRFSLEVFYWTKEEYIPKNNPYWEHIETVNCLKD